jgi:hypothetical protein
LIRAACGVRRDLTEGEHDCGWPALERDLQHPRPAGHAPGNEADADASVARGVELAAQPRLVAIAAADHAETAGPADGGSETSVGHEIHRRRDDRVPHPEQVRQSGGDRHRQRP